MLICSCGTDNGLLTKDDNDMPTTSLSNSRSQSHRNTADGHFTAGSTVGEVINDEAFGDFGRLLFPVDRDIPSSMTLEQVSTSSVYIYYTNIKVDKTVEIINYLRDESLNGRQIFYRPDEPYEDLARAITYIHDHASELGVTPKGYSLWGGSAGARMAATLGNSGYLRQLTGRTDIPQAAAVIMQYTGYSSVSRQDAPTYACVGSNDGIASWRTMQNRLQNLSALGIPTEFHVYEGLSHGFGIGTGTVADGWVDDAISFWKQNDGEDSTSGITQITK